MRKIHGKGVLKTVYGNALTVCFMKINVSYRQSSFVLAFYNIQGNIASEQQKKKTF